MGIKSINGLAKGLKVLARVAAVGGATVRQLAADLAIPEPTVARVLKTLQKEGFVLRARARRQYWVTRRLPELAAAIPPLALVVQVAGPHLEEIAATLDVSVMISGGDGARMEVLRANLRPAKLAITRFLPGYTFPSEESASGLMLRAHRPNGSRNSRLPAIKAVRKAGYAISPNRLDGRELCLAVPIVVKGTLCACLELRCMKAVADAQAMKQRFLGPARLHAAQIAAEVESLYGAGRSARIITR